MSALLAALRRRHRSVRSSGDRGTTMIELVMAMVIMSVCGAVFIGSMVALNRTTGKAQAATNAATQTNQAFLSLDKTVRYASVITIPGKGTSGDWYVELRDTTSGAETCVQLRLDTSTKQLRKRSWATANPSGVSAWLPIASGFTNGGAASGSADQPFVLKTPGPTSNHQQLTVNLVATAGNPPSVTTSRSSFTLTAINSEVPPPSGSVCRQVARP
jgi:type II secretory pathway pseudopilin PulG